MQNYIKDHFFFTIYYTYNKAIKYTYVCVLWILYIIILYSVHNTFVLPAYTVQIGTNSRNSLEILKLSPRQDIIFEKLKKKNIIILF